MTREELDRLIEDRRVFAYYSDAEKRLARLLRAALAVVDADAMGDLDNDGRHMSAAVAAFDAALRGESA